MIEILYEILQMEGRKKTHTMYGAALTYPQVTRYLEREHFRMEWLRHAEELLVEVGNASTVRDSARKVVDRLQVPSYAVRLRADATRLSRAVGNLVSDAIKYSPEGGGVTVKLEEGVEEAVLSVSDEGIGVPKDVVRHLFQPFYRVQQVETRQIEGLGLGLALTKAIVEAHGGRIWAESEPGKGSVFSFSMLKHEAGNEPALHATVASQ